MNLYRNFIRVASLLWVRENQILFLLFLSCSISHPSISRKIYFNSVNYCKRDHFRPTWLQLIWDKCYLGYKITLKPCFPLLTEAPKIANNCLIVHVEPAWSICPLNPEIFWHVSPGCGGKIKSWLDALLTYWHPVGTKCPFNTLFM